MGLGEEKFSETVRTKKVSFAKIKKRKKTSRWEKKREKKKNSKGVVKRFRNLTPKGKRGGEEGDWG